MHRDSKLHFPQSSTLFLSSASQTSLQNRYLYIAPLIPLPLHLLLSVFCPINSAKPDPATVTGGVYFRAAGTVQSSPTLQAPLCLWSTRLPFSSLSPGHPCVLLAALPPASVPVADSPLPDPWILRVLFSLSILFISDHIHPHVLITRLTTLLLLPLLLSHFSCVRLCDPIDGSPPGSSVPGILQARTLEWVAISFSNACMHAKLLQSCLTLCDPMDSSPPGSSIHRIL